MTQHAPTVSDADTSAVVPTRRRALSAPLARLGRASAVLVGLHVGLFVVQSSVPPLRSMGVAYAQPANTPATVTAPSPGKADDSPGTFLTYVVLLVLAAGIIGANLIPSKRGHQD